MRSRFLRAVLVVSMVGVSIPIGSAVAASLHAYPHVTSTGPLYAVGISGGITGTAMTATVYANGTVSVARQGGGQAHGATQYTVPLTVSSVRQVTRLARLTHVFAIPKSVQNKPFGADVALRTFTIYTANGERTVRAYGSESNHVRGTAAFFPVWGLLHALAGYPAQIG